MCSKILSTCDWFLTTPSNVSVMCQPRGQKMWFAKVFGNNFYFFLDLDFLGGWVGVVVLHFSKTNAVLTCPLAISRLYIVLCLPHNAQGARVVIFLQILCGLKFSSKSITMRQGGLTVLTEAVLTWATQTALIQFFFFVPNLLSRPKLSGPGLPKMLWSIFSFCIECKHILTLTYICMC